MPRWTALLALALLAAVGGAAQAWAEAPAPGATHEAPPPADPAPAGDADEEATVSSDWPPSAHVPSLGRLDGAVSVSVAAVPPVPPPR